tara:strand:+ start:440 stop:964 length:525 start_codon:yes stop_codon:yes gene_type:complete
MASGGGLEFKGGGTGFEGIGVDDRALMKQLEALRKQVADKKVQVRIHRRVGRMYQKEMLAHIYEARETIRVRRGRQSPIDIAPGTLRRSIRVWQIDKKNSTFWAGPRVGRKMPADSDAWFANIVEGDDQFIKGTNRHKDVFKNSIAATTPKALESMRKSYKKAIDKQVKKTRKQ